MELPDAPTPPWVGLTLVEQTRLLDLSNDAIIVRDVDNRIIYWNHGATELYGWTRAEAMPPQVLAVLNNAVIGIVLQTGERNLAAAQRRFAYQFDRCLAHLAS